MAKNSKRYNATQINAELFWKFPKFLLDNKKYEDLTNDARIAYMLIKDRYKYSLSNNWIDEKDDVYVYFTIEQLKDYLHVGKNKIPKIKKSLIEHGLLEIEKQGFDPKAQKNLPDKFYLLQPEYIAEDLISQTSQVQTHAQSGIPKIGTRSQNIKTTDITTFSPRENCNNGTSTDAQSGIPKIGINKDKINSDTIQDTNIDTDNWDFSKEKYSQAQINQQNQDLLNHLDQFLNTNPSQPMFLNKDSLNLIKMWFNTPEGVHDCISTILNAANDSKSMAQKQIGTHKINFEDYQGELQERITNCLRRYFNKMRTSKNGSIKNPKNYLYSSMLTLFDQWQNELLMADKKKNSKNNVN